MTPERWARLKEVFSQAAAMPAEERAKFVRQACVLSDGSNDLELLEEIDQMLRLNTSAGLAVDTPAIATRAVRGMLNESESWRSLAPDEMLGERFRILRHAGAGGMGEVYEAEDIELGTRVAIKTILPSLTGDERVLNRFRREVQLARQITHPNVCRIFDLMDMPRSTGGRAYFLTMEFLDGEPLSHRLRRDGAMTFSQALPVLEHVIAGLDAAHRAGVVHRDVKSSNIFLSKDSSGRPRAVITDFGLARTHSGESGISHTTKGSSVAIGTPAYLAPEQVEGKPVSPASDQYSFGVVMYEMATGVQPYDGDSPLQVAAKRIKERPRPPREVKADIPSRWEQAILRCLEYDPRDRFPDLQSVAEAMHGGLSVPYVRRTQAKRWGLWAAVAAVALTGAAFLGSRLLRPAPLPPEVARLYREGTSAMLNGSWHRANQALKAAVDAKPDVPEMRARYAETLMELDYFDRARAEVLKATDLPARSKVEELLVKGTRGLVLRDFPAACESFDSRVFWMKISGAEDRTSAALDLARCQDKAYMTGKAKASFEAVLASDATNPAALTSMAMILDREGRSEDALKLLDKARASNERTGLQEGVAEVDLQRATILEQISRLPESKEAASRALETAGKFSNRQLGLQAKLRLASLAMKLNNAPEGKRLAAEALEEARSAGMETMLASAFVDLSSTFYSQRQYEDAAMYAEQGMKQAEAIGAKRLGAQARRQLAHVRYRQNDREQEGLPLLDESDAFFRESGWQSELLRNDQVRASILTFLDRNQAGGKGENRGVALWKQTIPRARQLDDLRAELQALNALDQDAARSRDFTAAEEYASQALALAEKSGRILMQQTARTRLAEVKGRNGKLEEALKLISAVLADPELKDYSRQIAALRAKGVILAEMARPAEALQVFTTAMELATQRRQTADMRIVNYQMCLAAAEGNLRKETATACSLAEKQMSEAGFWALWVDVRTALAIDHMNQSQFDQAIRLAQESRAKSVSLKDERNAWYALLIQADAEQRKGDQAAFRKSAETARAELDGFRQRWGEQVLKLHLARPTIAARWNRVAPSGVQ